MSLLTQWQEKQTLINTAKKYSEVILENRPLYTELEYIQSTGTQYIDTGININDITLRVQIKTMGTGTGYSHDGFIFSSYYNNKYGLGDIYGDSERNKWCIYYGNNSSITTNLAYEDNVEYESDCTFTKTSYDMTINNNNATGTHSSYYPNNAPLVLFRRGNNSSYPFIGRMYYCKLYIDGILMRDFIPVKDENNIVCMYDKVSRTYFYNAGTGTFTAGPEV